MALEVGSVFARIGANFDGDGFDRFDRRLDRARQEARRGVEANLRADPDLGGFDRYGRALNEAQRDARQGAEAYLRADFDGRGFRDYEGAARRADRANDDLVRGSGRLRTAFGSLFIAGAGVAGATIGLGALANSAYSAVGAFQESNAVARRTENVLRTTGGAANVTAKQVGDLAAALSNKTGIDDDAIQSGENLLLTFTNVRNEAGRGNDVFTQATSSLADMSAALGQDTSSSAIQLGKALNDPIRGVTALQRVGVSFTKSQRDQIKTLVESGKTVDAQRLILGELRKEFGGAGEAVANSTAKLKVTLGNLQESIGGAIAPTFDKAANGLNKFIQGAQNGEGAGGRFVRVVKVIAANVADFARTAGRGFDRVRDAVSDAANNPSVRRLATNIGRTVSVVIDTVRNLGRTITLTFDGSGDDFRTIGRTVARVMAAIEDVIQPIVRRVIPAIGDALGDAVRIVRRVVVLLAALFRGDWAGVWRQFRGIVADAIDLVAGLLKLAVSELGRLARAIGKAILNGVIDFVEKLPGRALKLIRGIADRFPDAAAFLAGEAGKIGQAIVDGLVAGVEALAGKIANVGRSIGSSLLNAAKDFLGIRSPSREFAKVGGYIVDGLAKGMNPANVARVATKAFGGIPALAARLLKRGVIDLGSLPVKGAKALLSKAGGLLGSIKDAVVGKDEGDERGAKGVVQFQGKPVAAWIARILKRAQGDGVPVQVSSGFRSYAEQERLWNELGRDPRRVARPGTSNHEGSDYPRGAVDLTSGSWQPMVAWLARNPDVPLVHYAYPKDPYHFSATGNRMGGRIAPALTGGKVGPGAGGARAFLVGEGQAPEWVISQEGDRKANVRWAVEALTTLTGRRVELHRRGKGKAKPPAPKLSSKDNRGISRSIQRGNRGIKDYEDRIRDLERDYDLLNRKADLDPNDFLIENDDGSVTVDEAARADRERELRDLRAKRQEVRDTIVAYRAAIQRAIKAYNDAIKTLKAALDAAKGKARVKEREGYRERIADYRQRVEELAGTYDDLGYDRQGADVDLKELDAELDAATVKGAQAQTKGPTPEKPEDPPTPEELAQQAPEELAQQARDFDAQLTPDEAAAIAKVNKDVALAALTADTADDEAARAEGQNVYSAILARLQGAGATDEVITAAAQALKGFLPDAPAAPAGGTAAPAAPAGLTAADVAAQALANVTSFQSGIGSLLGQFGGNFVGRGAPLFGGAGALGGLRYFGGAAQAGMDTLTAGGIVQNITFTGPQPADPHTFTQAALYELRAAV